MNLELNNEPYQPQSVSVGTLKPTSVFYYAYIGLANSLKEEAVYMTTQGGKEKRTAIVNIFNGSVLQIDNNHQVVEMNAKIVYLLNE